jgi:hypothetical protein
MMSQGEQIDPAKPHGTYAKDATGEAGTWGTTNGNGLGPSAPWPAKLAVLFMRFSQSIGTTNVLLMAIIGGLGWAGYKLIPPLAIAMWSVHEESIRQTSIHDNIASDTHNTAQALAVVASSNESLAKMQATTIENQGRIIKLESQALDNHTRIIDLETRALANHDRILSALEQLGRFRPICEQTPNGPTPTSTPPRKPIMTN